MRKLILKIGVIFSLVLSLQSCYLEDGKPLIMNFNDTLNIDSVITHNYSVNNSNYTSDKFYKIDGGWYNKIYIGLESFPFLGLQIDSNVKYFSELLDTNNYKICLVLMSKSGVSNGCTGVNKSLTYSYVNDTTLDVQFSADFIFDTTYYYDSLYEVSADLTLYSSFKK